MGNNLFLFEINRKNKSFEVVLVNQNMVVRK